MKNLIYVFAFVIMGVVSCGTPSEKNTTCDIEKEVTSCSTDSSKTCCAEKG